MWRHRYIYSGHASAATAAHANLDIIEREGLVGRGLALETEIPAALAPLLEHELVSKIRGVTLEARDHGVLTRTLVGGGLQISPPLVITREELAEVASGLAGALDAVAAAH